MKKKVFLLVYLLYKAINLFYRGGAFQFSRGLVSASLRISRVWEDSDPLRPLPLWIRASLNAAMFERVGEAGVPVKLAPSWRGQAAPFYLAPPPCYLHSLGASCPGRFILPPPNTRKNTCNFVIFLCHFNEFRSSISHKMRNCFLWGKYKYWFH